MSDEQPAPADEVEPGSYGGLLDARVRFWVCKQHRRGRVEWRGEVAHCLEDPADEQEDCTGGHAIGCRHVEHPDAPLAEAGHLDVETARDMLLHPGGYGRSLLAVASEVVVTALDVRGRERDAARARIDAAFSAFEAAGYDLSENEGDLSDLVRELAGERDAARAEMEWLRARDEAAKPVVQWWAVASDPERSGEMRWDVPQEGREALDVLARAHETKDGGQDR